MRVSSFGPVLALVGLASLTGCTTYSTAVNSLGPDRAVSDLMDLDDEYVLSGTPPLFCPAPETYMILPEDDQGALNVLLNNDEQYLLEGDYAALEVTEPKRTEFTGDPEQITALYGDAIEALPAPPIYHTVYFELDSTQLTPESQALVEGIYQEILDNFVLDVLVIGHTDTQASAAYNMELSLARAEAIKNNLIDIGISEDLISVEARGETDLLVNTADNVDEVRNRRVVINLR